MFEHSPCDSKNAYSTCSSTPLQCCSNNTGAPQTDPKSDRTSPSSSSSKPQLKSHSYKYINHTRLRTLSSPYAYVERNNNRQQSTQNNQQQHQHSTSSLLVLEYSSSEAEDSSSLVHHHQQQQLHLQQHPTTPVSSSLNDDSSSMISQQTSPSLASLLRKNVDIKSDTGGGSSSSCSNNTGSALFVTPATAQSPTTSQTSGVGGGVCDGGEDEFAFASTEPITRTTSCDSLSSFNVKSSFTPSVASVYSSHMNTDGCTTPSTSGYSDLPGSPSECCALDAVTAMGSRQQLQPFYNQNFYASKLNSTMNSNLPSSLKTTPADYKNRYMTLTAAHEEISILTVDSNPKSNDITIIERTMLSNGAHNYQHQQNPPIYPHQQYQQQQQQSILITANYVPLTNDSMLSTSSSSGDKYRNQSRTFYETKQPYLVMNLPNSNGTSSAYNSASSSFLLNSTANNTIIGGGSGGSGGGCNDNNVNNYGDDETTKEYALEGSLYDTGSPRSNVSSLMIQAPTADLTFIRQLLATKARSTPNSTNVITKDLNGKKTEIPYIEKISKRPWTTATANYTPPVKDHSTLPPLQTENPTTTINRALFRDTPQHSSKLPRPTFPPNHQDSDNDSLKNFSSAQELGKDDEETASLVSIPNCIRLDSCPSSLQKSNFKELFSKLNSSEKKQIAIDSPSNFYHQRHHQYEHNIATNNITTRESYLNNSPFCQRNFVSLNNSECVEDVGNGHENEEDDEEEFINDFIEECYKQNKENTEMSLNDSTDPEIDIDQVLSEPHVDIPSFVNPLKQESEMVASRILPKIEEEEDSDDTEKVKHGEKDKKKVLNKKLSTSSMSSQGYRPATSSSSSSSAPLAKVVMNKTARLRMANKLKEIKANNELSSASNRNIPVMTCNKSKNSLPCKTTNFQEKESGKKTTPTPIGKMEPWHNKSGNKSVLSSINLHSNQFNKK